MNYTGIITRISKYENPVVVLLFRDDQLVGRFYEIYFDSGEAEFQYLYDALSILYGSADASWDALPDLFYAFMTGSASNRNVDGIIDIEDAENVRLRTWMIDENTSVTLFGALFYDTDVVYGMNLLYAHPVKTEYDFYGL